MANLLGTNDPTQPPDPEAKTAEDTKRRRMKKQEKVARRGGKKETRRTANARAKLRAQRPSDLSSRAATAQASQLQGDHKHEAQHVVQGAEISFVPRTFLLQTAAPVQRMIERKSSALFLVECDLFFAVLVKTFILDRGADAYE